MKKPENRTWVLAYVRFFAFCRCLKNAKVRVIKKHDDALTIKMYKDRGAKHAVSQGLLLPFSKPSEQLKNPQKYCKN